MGFEQNFEINYELMFFEPPLKIHHLLLFSNVQTMMVFDEWYSGVPMVYIIISSYKKHHLAPWMDPLNKRLLMFQSDWHPNAFIMDDARVEINSSRYRNDFNARY